MNKIIGKLQEKYPNKKIEYFSTINSTHKKAKEIVDSQKEKETILITEEQEGGIGTKERTWYTGKGDNIACSIIYPLNCPISELDGFTIKVAQRIKEVIDKLYHISLDIKMPNDLLLNHKKICGILTEITTQGEKVKSLIISIGFNVNEINFPDHLIEIATSLKKEYERDFSKEQIMEKIVEELEKEIKLF